MRGIVEAMARLVMAVRKNSQGALRLGGGQPRLSLSMLCQPCGSSVKSQILLFWFNPTNALVTIDTAAARTII